MAKGYLVATLDVRDAEAYAPYREQVPEIIARHGGRYLVRGGAFQTLEGEVSFSRLVVVEFPSVEATRAFYDDPDYRRIIHHRTDNAVGTLVIAEGCSS
jgi:uncharacterized protein (DUF1330 family)